MQFCQKLQLERLTQAHSCNQLPQWINAFSSIKFQASLVAHTLDKNKGNLSGAH